MQSVLFETPDPVRFTETKRFFERHLVDIRIIEPLSFERNRASYTGLDALLLSVGENISEVALYLEQITSQLECPAIVVMDQVRSESEETNLLDAGAADCVSPPIGPRELLARLRARSRRFQIFRENSIKPNYRFASFGVDCGTHELLTRNRAVKLAKKEFSLLSHFLRNNFAGITREELLSVVSAENLDVNDRSIDSLVSRLRERLKVMGEQRDLIKTIRGFGYTLDCDVSLISGDADLKALL